jgi:hypothetical protein
MKKLLIIALLVAACGGAAATTHNLTGSLTLSDAKGITRSQPGALDCAGSGGYSDISTSGQIIVTDDKGGIVGTAPLTGQARSVYGTAAFRDEVDSRCVVTFALTVPDAPFYTITIGRRDTTTSRADLERQGWRLDLTLGG